MRFQIWYIFNGIISNNNPINNEWQAFDLYGSTGLVWKGYWNVNISSITNLLSTLLKTHEAVYNVNILSVHPEQGCRPQRNAAWTSSVVWRHVA